MALNFPDSPSLDQEFVSGATTWKWDGTVWNALGVTVTSITVADESSDTTSFLGFYTAATGALEPKTNAGLTFNAATTDVGITSPSTTSASTGLTVTARGDAYIALVADTNSDAETNNPYVSFSQDATAVLSNIGQTAAADIDAQGNTFTGAANNGLSIHHQYASQVNIGVNGVVGLTINDTDGILVANTAQADAFLSVTPGNGFYGYDNVKAAFGLGVDMTIYHDGNDNYIDSVLSSAELHLRVNSTEDSVVCFPNGAAVFYYDGTSSSATQDFTAAANTSAMNIKDHAGTVRDVGFNDAKLVAMTTSNIVLDNTHAGQVILRTGTSTVTLSVAAGSEFPTGSMCTVLNHGTSGSLTISDGAEDMYIMNGDGTAPTNSTGFVLAISGCITIWRQGVSAYYVWGAGIP